MYTTTKPLVRALDHVQLAMPAGSEAEATAFYAGVLGFTEVPKPAALAGRGGAWFEAGSVRLHLGVEAPFRPACKAHPAFEVTRLADAIRALEAAGAPIQPEVDLPGIARIFTADPFGNRIELLERL